jgi:hypothetical protein
MFSLSYKPYVPWRGVLFSEKKMNVALFFELTGVVLLCGISFASSLALLSRFDLKLVWAVIIAGLVLPLLSLLAAFALIPHAVAGNGRAASIARLAIGLSSVIPLVTGLALRLRSRR